LQPQWSSSPQRPACPAVARRITWMLFSILLISGRSFIPIPLGLPFGSGAAPSTTSVTCGPPQGNLAARWSLLARTATALIVEGSGQSGSIRNGGSLSRSTSPMSKKLFTTTTAASNTANRGFVTHSISSLSELETDDRGRSQTRRRRQQAQRASKLFGSPSACSIVVVARAAFAKSCVRSAAFCEAVAAAGPGTVESARPGTVESAADAAARRSRGLSLACLDSAIRVMCNSCHRYYVLDPLPWRPPLARPDGSSCPKTVDKAVQVPETVDKAVQVPELTLESVAAPLLSSATPATTNAAPSLFLVSTAAAHRSRELGAASFSSLTSTVASSSAGGVGRTRRSRSRSPRSSIGRPLLQPLPARSPLLQRSMPRRSKKKSAADAWPPMVPLPEPPRCTAYLDCRNYVEPDCSSRNWCKSCIAKIDIQRARGALRAKMPAILVGRCKVCFRAKAASCTANGCRLQVAGPIYALHLP